MDQNGLILYFDIKDLGSVNDSFGHSAGDAAIRGVGEIIKNHFRSNDIIARVGGDRFAVISPGFTVDSYKRVKDLIVKACEEWTQKNNHPFSISITTAFVMFPSLKFGYTLSSLMDKAEEALENEKRK